MPLIRTRVAEVEFLHSRRHNILGPRDNLDVPNEIKYALRREDKQAIRVFQMKHNIMKIHL